MPLGRVLRRQGGFYYVESDEHLFECKLRGKIKKDNVDVLVGDKVEFTALSDLDGVVEDVLPRINVLVRPQIANIDQVLPVFSLREPEPIWHLLDRILVSAEAIGIGSVICLTKSDLESPEDIAQAEETYRKADYPVLIVSSKGGTGLDGVRDHLKDKVTCLAGPSGVGKSSLINALDPNLKLKIGEISEKIQRGKHTTRHVELLHISSGGLLADTPGFSRLAIDAEPEELGGLFPEIDAISHQCKFSSCSHIKEPKCAVKQAVEEGSIPKSRYESYLLFYEEVSTERRY